MFRKLIAMFLAIMMLCAQFAIAEDAERACCGCTGMDVQRNNDVEPAELTAEEAYKAWFLAVHPLLYSCYANSTWIMNWFVDTSGGNVTHLKVTYLLKEDMLSITAEEMNEFVPIRSDYKENIYHMHSYIHVTPATLATVRALKATNLFGY